MERIKAMGSMGELTNFFSGKKVLITGHTGFKGAWLARILANRGAQVAGLGASEPPAPNLFGILGLEKQVRHYIADVKSFEKVLEVLNKEKPEIVFHLAAQALVRRSYDEPLLTYQVNTLGTVNILEAMRRVGSARAIVCVTTDKVYANKSDANQRMHANDTNGFKEDDPLGGHDPYSASKAAADIIAHSYIQSYGMPIGVSRAGNVIGGGDWGKDRIIPDIIRAFYEKNEKIVIRYPHAVRPWQYVLEPLAGYMLLAKALYENGGGSFLGAWNFGPEASNFVSVEDLLKKAIEILGRGGYEIVPDVAKPEARALTLDSSKAMKFLGWKPKLDFNQTLLATMNWYKNYYSNPALAAKATDDEISRFFSIG